MPPVHNAYLNCAKNKHRPKVRKIMSSRATNHFICSILSSMFQRTSPTSQPQVLQLFKLITILTVSSSMIGFVSAKPATTDPNCRPGEFRDTHVFEWKKCMPTCIGEERRIYDWECKRCCKDMIPPPTTNVAASTAKPTTNVATPTGKPTTEMTTTTPNPTTVKINNGDPKTKPARKETVATVDSTRKVPTTKRASNDLDAAVDWKNIAIGVGIVLGIATIAGVAICLYRRRRNNNDQQRRMTCFQCLIKYPTEATSQSTLSPGSSLSTTPVMTPSDSPDSRFFQVPYHGIPDGKTVIKYHPSDLQSHSCRSSCSETYV